jgi:50S ribosomal subunit-associated GTPase HflX
MSDCSINNNMNRCEIRFKIFDKIIGFKIWNNQEIDLRNNFFSFSQIIFFLYDICNPLSLNTLKEIVKNINQMINRNNIKYILIGNKIDLEKNRKITFEKISSFVNEYKFDFNIEISSINGENILKLFKEITKILLDDFKEKEGISLSDISNQSNYEEKFYNNDAILFNMKRKKSYMDEDYKEEVNKINKKKTCYLC